MKVRFFLVSCLLVLITFQPSLAQNLTVNAERWNSWDCDGLNINEKSTIENLDVFFEKLVPHRFEYFVLDAGWYHHFDLKEEEI